MGGVQRFFAWAGDRSGNKTPVSATATPIAMSAISPIEGGYWRRDPFGSMSAKTVNPGAAKLPPVTEMSPDTPKQRDQPPIEEFPPPPPQEEKVMQISSPIEARNSMGFSESRGPVHFGDHRSGANTPAMGSRTNTPVPIMTSRANTPVPIMTSRTGTPNLPIAIPHYQIAMAPAPPPPPPPPPPPRRPSPPVASLPQEPLTPPASRAPNSPLPAPPPEAFNRGNGKNGSAVRKPAGLAIQWPPMDTVIYDGTSAGSKHTRTGSRNTPPVPNGRPVPRTEANDLDGFLTLLDNVNNKRMDSQRAAPRFAGRRRAESPDIRARDGSRGASRQRSSDRRGRQTGRQEAPQMRSPSSPLPMSPQAIFYREDAEESGPHGGDFEDERYYTKERRVASRSRGRAESRNPAASAMRSPSSPLPSSAQAQLYRDEDGDAEKYYTMAPRNDSRSRARSRGRSNTRVPGTSAARSPSSPLPSSLGGQMYAEMVKEAEQEENQPRYPRRTAREDFRTRGYQGGGGIRRSRSEHTMRQWSDQLERAGAIERQHSVSAMMNRKISVRGLPATPRAWKNELGSRTGSPAPITLRDGSLAMAPAPPQQRSMTTPMPSAPFSPVYRAMSPALSTLGAMSPAPRTFTPPLSGGNSSNSRSQSISEAVGMSTALRGQNFYQNEPDHYDPTIPRVPSLPINHSRNNSAPNPDFKPLIRKLPPQAPPDSPPPLPHDLPVHPALQMHLNPSTPGGKGGARGKSIRRLRRNDDIMSPIDSVLRDHEHSIIVGIDGGEAGLHWEDSNRYNKQQQRHHQEMQQLRRHGHSPSIGSQHSGHSGHGPIAIGPRDSGEAIGSTNQF